MRMLVLYSALFVIAFFAVRVISGELGSRVPEPPGRHASGQATSASERKAPAAAAAGLPPPALKSTESPRLSGLDQAILTAPSVQKAQEIVMARSALQSALSGWILRHARRCPGLKASVPSRLHLMVHLRSNGASRAEVYAVDSLQIAEGAPLAEGGWNA